MHSSRSYFGYLVQTFHTGLSSTCTYAPNIILDAWVIWQIGHPCDDVNSPKTNSPHSASLGSSSSTFCSVAGMERSTHGPTSTAAYTTSLLGSSGSNRCVDSFLCKASGFGWVADFDRGLGVSLAVWTDGDNLPQDSPHVDTDLQAGRLVLQGPAQDRRLCLRQAVSGRHAYPDLPEVFVLLPNSLACFV